MKIYHVITGLPQAAGTSTYVGEVCNHLASAGDEVTLVTGWYWSKNYFQCNDKVKRIHLPDFAEMVRKDGDSVKDLPDVIHVHALWSRWLHDVSNWAYKQNIPVVWSTHGSTAPWSMRHKWWFKWPVWFLCQKHDLLRARLVHSTVESELQWNEKLGLGRGFISPLGCHLPPSVIPTPRSVNPLDPLRILFVGRINRVKGLTNLVHAVARLPKKNIRIRIVGPDQEGHRLELVKECGRLDVASLFDFAGPKFGGELELEYDGCDILVLPSFTENFGGVVVDAMAHARPVIVSRKAPWHEVETYGCGWWVDNDEESLAGALEPAMNCSAERLSEMGNKGRKLVEERYQWSAVVDQLRQTYRKAIGHD